MREHYQQSDFCSTDWVYVRLKTALERQCGLSLVRLGDGETRAIAHGDLLPLEEIPPWLSYSGVVLPDQEVKVKLITAIKRANIIGLPVEELCCFKPLMEKIIKKYHLKLKYICHNRINYHLYNSGFLLKLIENRKIIIIGRQAVKATQFFNRYSRVVAAYDLPNFSYLYPTLRIIREKPDFELALVAAGIPAVVLCPYLAGLGKVAIDLGHVIDGIVNPEQNLFQLMEQYLKKIK